MGFNLNLGFERSACLIILYGKELGPSLAAYAVAGQNTWCCGAHTDIAARLQSPSFEYLEDAHTLVLSAVQELAHDAFGNFPNLSSVVQDQVIQLTCKSMCGLAWLWLLSSSKADRLVWWIHGWMITDGGTSCPCSHTRQK